MFQMGDQVIHPFTGRGIVVGISNSHYPGIDRELLIRWEYDFLGSNWIKEVVLQAYLDGPMTESLTKSCPDCQADIPLAAEKCDRCYMADPSARRR